ncbi:MAG: recombinase family protein [Nitrososphaeria archaeon]
MAVALTSYLLLFVTLTSYFHEITTCCIAPTSYLLFLAFQLTIDKFYQANPVGKEFWVEEFGGNGPRVAAYLRVSTSKQAKEGLSLEVQKERLEAVKEKHKPSKIYWFIDPGVSGEDFDNRKIKEIMKLREKKEIDELWVTHVDRIGRECEDSLFFFLRFCKDGGLIRTPDRTYGTKDLADIMLFVMESYVAESENKRRAERANASKIQNFKKKKWNKPIPLGYRRSGDGWIEKIPGYGPIIQDIFDLFIKYKSYSRVAKEITNKYNAVLNRPLSRDVIKRVLSDPVYVGHPSFLGETVIDESLRYIDDATFEKCRSFMHDNSSNINGSVQQKSSTLAQLTQVYDVSLLDFIDEVAELHHRRCGGILTRNGSRFENSTLQQVYKCNKCNAQFRIPTKRMLEKLSEQNRIQSTNLIPQTQQSSKQRTKQQPKRSVQTSLFDYSASPTWG